MANFLSILKQVAPWISAAATCNVPALLGLAAQTVSGVVGKPIASNSDAISAAIAGATPEQLLAIKQADAQMALQMQQLGFQQAEDLEKIAADDRASARQRQMTLKDRTPPILAFMVTLGFFGLLASMLTVNIPGGSEKIIDIMVGSLGGAWISVCNYYFGSSAAHDAMTQAQAKT